jgi:6-phosphogluconolactonase
MAGMMKVKISVCGVVRSLAVALGMLAAVATAGTTQFAYGVNAADWSLSQYRVNPETGALRHNDHIPIIKYPVAVAVHPSGRFVLTVIKTGDKVAVHRVDPVSGRLIEVPGSPFSVGARSPYSISIHPSGRFVYVAARWGGVVAFAMDVQSGVLTLVKGSPFAAQKRTRSVRVHPSGRFVYAVNAYSNSISAYHVNQETGALSPVAGAPFSTGEPGDLAPGLMHIMDAPPEAGGVPYRLEIHPSGRFIYVTNWMGASLSVFEVNAQTGALTPLPDGPVKVGGRPYGVAVHPSGRFVYVTSWDSQAVWGYVVDQESGHLTLLPTSPFLTYGGDPISMTFNKAGTQAYVANVNSNTLTQFSADADSGTLSLVETLRTRYEPFDIVLQEVGGATGLAPRASYHTDFEHGQLRVMKADVESGNFTVLGKIALPSGLLAATVESLGRYVYVGLGPDPDSKVAPSAKGRLAVYRINSMAGSLERLPDMPYLLDFVPTELVLDTSGQFLYAIDPNLDELRVFAVNPDNGVLGVMRVQPPHTGRKPVAIALDPAARFSFVANAGDNTVSVFTHRREGSPAFYPIYQSDSRYPVGSDPSALVVDPTGKYLFVANRGDNSLSMFNIHFHEGLLEAVPGTPVPTGTSPVAVAVHPDGEWVLVANRESSDISIYRLNALSGALAAQSSLKVEPHPMEISFGPDGRYLYVRFEGLGSLRKFTLDTTTGKLTPAGKVTVLPVTSVDP